MKEYIRNLHAKGIPTLLAAAGLILLFQFFNLYMANRQNEEVAYKLMKRELEIVDWNIMWELVETETYIDDLSKTASSHLAQPEKLLNDTYNIMLESDFILAVAIGFEPNFFPEKGYWFEPRCVRRDSQLVKEQIGGPDHDYFKMDWYQQGMEKTGNGMFWTSPYIDHSQNDEVIISLIQPLFADSTHVAGVMCIDVSLMALKQLLEKAEPYPGSICQLLDSEGNMLVSSDNTKLDRIGYFVDSKKLARHNLQIQLACPKSAIYGPTALQNLITLIMAMAALLLLAYIVQRSLRDIIHLNDARKQQLAVENEMQFAHDIQMNILRHDFPKEIHAILLPMKEVGGDLYDFYQKGNTTYFIIGDVAGKGLPAAMMMAATVNLFRLAVQLFSTPAEIVSKINSVISEHNPDLIFITIFVGKLDMQHGLLTYCNAGHNPPVVNGRLMTTDPDIPIGYDANYEFRSYGELFQEGSRMVLYTDGITEARNQDRQFLGNKHLLSIIDKYYLESIEEMNTHIFRDTLQYTNHTEQSDDMTLMCLTNNTPPTSPSLIISNETEEIGRVKLLLREFCVCAGCDRRLTRKILLAAEEAVANVIDYAYPKGELGTIEINILVMPTTKAHNGDITIVISDQGIPFNPLAQSLGNVEQAINNRQVGGLGIYLYQNLMDNVIYKRTDDGRNVLVLTKKFSNK